MMMMISGCKIVKLRGKSSHFSTHWIDVENNETKKSKKSKCGKVYYGT
jgi:hypothetical protein